MRCCWFQSVWQEFWWVLSGDMEDKSRCISRPTIRSCISAWQYAYLPGQFSQLSFQLYRRRGKLTTTATTVLLYDYMQANTQKKRGCGSVCAKSAPFYVYRPSLRRDELVSWDRATRLLPRFPLYLRLAQLMNSK